MTAELISLPSGAEDSSALERVAKALAGGALVAFPTETVYGLAANAADANAMERLRAVKGRAAAQPFTVHIAGAGASDAFVPDISDLGRRFMRKGWPGPLSLIFKVGNPEAASVYPDLSEAGRESIYGLGSVGLRCPDHDIAVGLLDRADAPIVASSANLTGEEPPVDAESISTELAAAIDFIIDSGPTRYRKSSTIVELNGDGYRLLRAGVWDERTIQRFSTVNILFVCTGNTCRSPMAEGICRKMLADKLDCAVDDLVARGVVVASAGTVGFAGGLASPEAVEVCRERGIDIASHRSQGLTAELVHAADHVFALAGHHAEAIRAVSPGNAGKVALLDPAGDVGDPIGGTADVYAKVADQVTRAIEARLNEVAL